MARSRKLFHSKCLSLPPLVLASRSPRRRQLLKTLGFGACRARIPRAEESPATGRNVLLVTQKNALKKAQSALEKITNQKTVVIGADTVVVIDGRVLGKPASLEEGRAHLKRLSGRYHTVVTGLALLSHHFGSRTTAIKSRVKFKKLTKAEIEDYLSTPEPYDKAGAYAIQGMASVFIEKIQGSYTNVMGFPIEAFLLELSQLTKIPLHRWFSK